MSSFLDPNISTEKSKFIKPVRIKKIKNNEDDSIRDILAELAPAKSSFPEISTGKNSQQKMEILKHSGRMSFLKKIEQKAQRFTKRISDGDALDSSYGVSKILDNAVERLPTNIIDYKAMSIHEPSFLSKVKDKTIMAIETDIGRNNGGDLSRADLQMKSQNLQAQVNLLRESLNKSKRY